VNIFKFDFFSFPRLRQTHRRFLLATLAVLISLIIPLSQFHIAEAGVDQDFANGKVIELATINNLRVNMHDNAKGAKIFGLEADNSNDQKWVVEWQSKVGFKLRKSGTDFYFTSQDYPPKEGMVTEGWVRSGDMNVTATFVALGSNRAGYYNICLQAQRDFCVDIDNLQRLNRFVMKKRNASYEGQLYRPIASGDKLIRTGAPNAPDVTANMIGKTVNFIGVNNKSLKLDSNVFGGTYAAPDGQRRVFAQNHQTDPKQQAWRIVRCSSGGAGIVNVGNNLALNVPINNTAISSWTTSDPCHPHQNFSFKSINGKVAIIHNETGKAIDIPNNGNTFIDQHGNSDVLLWNFHGEANQTFNAPDFDIKKIDGNTRYLPFFGTSTLTQGTADTYSHNDILNDFAIDIGLRTGEKVVSVAKGTVLYAGWKEKWGNVVAIKYSIENKGRIGHYLHLNSLSVKRGQSVYGGQVLGEAGGTWSSTRSLAPHLHYHEAIDLFGNSVALLGFEERTDTRYSNNNKLITSQNEGDRR
jgi:Peptidase family M23